MQYYLRLLIETLRIKLLAATLLLFISLPNILYATGQELPVYRFWSEEYLHHFYTISEYEKDYIISMWPDVWKYEGPRFYAFETQIRGTSPVYRFWSEQYLGHFYTISEDEKNYVLETWPDVWKYEGPAFYAYTTQAPDMSPVYRFWSEDYLGHFYTVNEVEKDQVKDTWPDVWQYEGSVFFTKPYPLELWQLRNPLCGHNRYDISYGNDIFVTVGDSVIQTSTDGNAWTEIPGTYPVNAVTYGNGKFVAVGQTILTSTDGINWDEQSAGVYDSILYGVTFGNGMFVAVGLEGTIIKSFDGINWYPVSSPGTNRTLHSVIYGNNTFVAVGVYGTIATSSDGDYWFVSDGGQDLYGVAYGNSTFVVVGYAGTIYSSSDGITWIDRHPDTLNDFSGVSYGHGIFVAVGRYGTVAVSSDGATWNVTSIGTAASLNAIRYINETFVVVSSCGDVYNSPDGFDWSNWTTNNFATAEKLNDVTYENGLFVGVGGLSTIVTSTDGIQWYSRMSDGSVYSELRSVTYGNGIFVSVGSGYYEGLILSSFDGIQWTARESNTLYPLNKVVFGNGTFVAIGENGIVLTSPDGISWTIRTPISFQLNDIAFGNGIFVGVGNDGTIVTSSNGIYWNEEISDTTVSLNAVMYENEVFVAVGGIVTVSSDGMHWNEISDSNYTFNTIAYGNNTYVAAGIRYICGRPGCSPRLVFSSSEDGVIWVDRSISSEFFAINGIAYGNSTFVVVGDEGKIYQSGSFAE